MEKQMWLDKIDKEVIETLKHGEWKSPQEIRLAIKDRWEQEKRRSLGTLLWNLFTNSDDYDEPTIPAISRSLPYLMKLRCIQRRSRHRIKGDPDPYNEEYRLNPKGRWLKFPFFQMPTDFQDGYANI